MPGRKLWLTPRLNRFKFRCAGVWYRGLMDRAGMDVQTCFVGRQALYIGLIGQEFFSRDLIAGWR